MIRVEKDAQRTDAYQKNDNLVLSDSARADSIPGLEIEANDVRCTHGATAGRVDEEMIFYAQARAIDARDRDPADRRRLLRQRLRPDHARARAGDAPPGRRRQARSRPAASNARRSMHQRKILRRATDGVHRHGRTHTLTPKCSSRPTGSRST